MIWPLNGSKAGGDLAFTDSSAFVMYCTYLALEQLDLHNKSSEVCHGIKTKGAFFWDYSGIGILGIDGDRVLLEHIPFSE